jgi:hypothetical protein
MIVQFAKPCGKVLSCQVLNALREWILPIALLSIRLVVLRLFSSALDLGSGALSHRHAVCWGPGQSDLCLEPVLFDELVSEHFFDCQAEEKLRAAAKPVQITSVLAYFEIRHF